MDHFATLSRFPAQWAGMSRARHTRARFFRNFWRDFLVQVGGRPLCAKIVEFNPETPTLWVKCTHVEAKVKKLLCTKIDLLDRKFSKHMHWRKNLTNFDLVPDKS